MGVSWGCVVLVAPVWSSWQLIQLARGGSWRNPGWFARATWTSLYFWAGAWLWGLFSQAGIAKNEDVCRWAGQHYDAAYRDAHQAAARQLFPLSDPCNASYDLVPFWVNPAVVAFGFAFTVSLCGLTTTLLVREFARLKDRR